MVIELKPVEIAAWWGATVATLVFLWDIYKWRQSGATVNLTVTPNMQFHGVIPNWANSDQNLVVVEAVNIGSKKTTITHLFAYHYKDIWARLLRKRTKTLVVMRPLGTQPLPHELDGGARWLSAMNQNQELEQLSRNGYLYVGIHHSVAEKPVLARLVIVAKSDV